MKSYIIRSVLVMVMIMLAGACQKDELISPSINQEKVQTPDLSTDRTAALAARFAEIEALRTFKPKSSEELIAEFHAARSEVMKKAAARNATACEEVIINTQEELEAFNCTEVSVLQISEYGNNITSLEPLSILTSVDFLQIFECDGLTDLQGLENITSVQHLGIWSNSGLLNLAGLDNLISVSENVFIFDNNGLISLQGLNSLNYAGTIEISDNADLTNLNGLNNLTSVEWYLNINNHPSLTEITSLSNLNTVRGMRIFTAPDLTSLQGLNNLTTVTEWMEIFETGILDLTGLEKLASAMQLAVVNNPNLESVTGLHNLTSLGGLHLNGNPKLYDLSGLDQFTVLQELSIWNNTVLTDLSGLENLASVGFLVIYSNPSLPRLSGLENLTSVEWLIILNNPSLASLRGLDKLQTIGFYLEIGGNTNLSLCCQVYPFISAVTYKYIYDNNTGCNSELEILTEGPCILAPHEAINELSTQLQDFITNGEVDSQGSQSLFNQLDQALDAYCAGDIDQAIHKLEVFITLVQAKIPNKIDPVAGQELMDAAQAIIDQLLSGEFMIEC